MVACACVRGAEGVGLCHPKVTVPRVVAPVP